MRGLVAYRRIAAPALALVPLAALAAGCGQKPQDVNEPKGQFPVQVEAASFPSKQSLAETSNMRIVVRNVGQKTIPNISVTVKCSTGFGGGSFSTTTSDVNVSDPERPVFVVNNIPTALERRSPSLDPAPLERSSAYVDTYPLGSLAPDHKAVFIWNVTAVKAGAFHICWRVNAGLYGKAKAVADDGGPAEGRFDGTISDKAPQAKISNDDHTVETQGRHGPGVSPTPSQPVLPSNNLPESEGGPGPAQGGQPGEATKP